MRARVAEDEKENNSPELKSEEMVSALGQALQLIDSFYREPALKNAGDGWTRKSCQSQGKQSQRRSRPARDY